MKKSYVIGWGPALSGAALLLLFISLLSAQAPQRKPPEKPQVVDMGDYKVSAPPGGNWEAEVDREAGRVIFSKSKGKGLLLAFVPTSQQRETIISVSMGVLPAAQWRLTEDEAANRWVDSFTVVGLGQESLALIEKGDTELNGKKLRFKKFPTFFSGEGVTTDLLVYFYFPPDFRKIHRYFRFESVFSRVAGGVKLYQNPESEPVFAVIDSLEIADPLQTAPGADGELLRAARAGDVEAVRQAIDKGSAPDASFGNGTALSTAAYHGRQEVVDFLLEQGAGIDHVDEVEGGTPLFMAVKGLEPVIAGYLVERGADVNKKTKAGTSPLMMAASTVQADLVSLLVDRGADIKAKDEEGLTALMFAAESGSLEIAQFLIDLGADVNVQSDYGTTALMGAINMGNTDVARLLMEKGADINLRSDEGWTALWSAVESGRTEMARILIEKGTDVNAQLEGERGDNTPSPLHLALYKDAPDMAKVLVEAGADINVKNGGGLTPLMRAAAGEHADIVRLLLEKGADVNAKNKDNWTALKYAKKYGSKEIVRILQAAGAK